MEEELKRITTAFSSKMGTETPDDIWTQFYTIEKIFKESNEALEDMVMAKSSYSFQEEAITKMTDDMKTLKGYVLYAHAYVSETLDFPLFNNFSSRATESLSRIVLDDLTTDNNIGMEEHVTINGYGFQVNNKRVKKELKFSDFLGIVNVEPEDGYPVLENVETMGEFASLFRADYDKMKPADMDVNTFLEGYLVSGEYNHKSYHPVKDFLSGLLDITIIKPVIECVIGEDLITGEDLTDLEAGLKLAGAVVDLFTLGQAMVLTKGAGMGIKAVGKTLVLELASNAATYTVGYGCEALGMPVAVTWALSIATGCSVSMVGGKYLFTDGSGKVVKECLPEEVDEILKVSSEGGGSTINGLNIIDGKVDGKIPLAEYEKYRVNSVHNIDSDTMTLGKYEPTIRVDGTKDFSVPGPGAYTVKAGDTTYFSLGTEWDKITDTYGLDAAGQNMFDYFNKPALDDAVSAGKEIRFSHNPEAYGECALKWEWDYLQEKHGYFALEKKGDFWYATK